MKITLSVIKADIGSIGGHIISMREGRFTEAVGAFAHPFWDTVRDEVLRKAVSMRRRGFFGAAMLPMAELEYTGILQTLEALKPRFRTRETSRGEARTAAVR